MTAQVPEEGDASRWRPIFAMVLAAFNRANATETMLITYRGSELRYLLEVARKRETTFCCTCGIAVFEQQNLPIIDPLDEPMPHDGPGVNIAPAPPNPPGMEPAHKPPGEWIGASPL